MAPPLPLFPVGNGKAVESAIRVPLGATTVPFTVTNAPVVDPKSPAIKATVNGRTKSTVISVKPGS